MAGEDKMTNFGEAHASLEFVANLPKEEYVAHTKEAVPNVYMFKSHGQLYIRSEHGVMSIDPYNLRKQK